MYKLLSGLSSNARFHIQIHDTDYTKHRSWHDDVNSNQQLKHVRRCAARFVKKDYRYTTSVTGLLDELGWLHLFERRKHSRLTVFHKALNNLLDFSLDHLSVSSRQTSASNENKFVSLTVRTDVFKYSFFLGPLLIGIPSHWLFVSCSRLSPSTGLCRTLHPPTVADYHDIPAVTGGLHPLLDIAPKNRRTEVK